MNWDVVTLGETMIRLTPPGFDRLEQTNSLELHVGGSESNTAVGLARLGSKVTWLSRLPNNPLGARVASALSSNGVDVAHVVWSDQDRMGTYYLERGKPPRAAQVYYDRAESAMSRMRPSDLPTELFKPGKAKLFHTTGITLGISSSARETAMAAVKLATQAGWRVAFDVNYRAKLWAPEKARAACMEILPLCNLLFLPIRDAKTVFGLDGSNPEATIQELKQLVPKCVIVMTLGAEGSIACDEMGKIIRQSAIPTTEVERLGSGDAFSAGFLNRFLASGDVSEGLRWATAMASLKYTIPGDLPLIHRHEVESLANAKGSASNISR